MICDRLNAEVVQVIKLALRKSLAATKTIRSLSARQGISSEHLELDAVGDVADLLVNAQYGIAQNGEILELAHAVVHEEQNFEDSADPRLNVVVCGDVRLFVDPIERVEDTVEADGHHEDLAGAILCVGVTVAEDVLRHEGKAFEELRE